MKLFCKLPFSRISIDDSGFVYPSCCPDWVEFPLGNIFLQDWEDIWYGADAKKMRDSMFDGSLRHCKRNWCPYIADVEAGIENYHVIPHEQSPKEWVPQPPVHVNLNYDQTCNLKCPTCRPDYIHNTGNNFKRVQIIQDYVEKNILPMVESVSLTGVGDPFMSRVFRNFLINFDSKKYPNIKTIHLHTNGLLFDEKMYAKMKGIHNIRLATDISIDATNKEVYSVVRNPGNWDQLMENLQFIKKIDNLVLLGISMVVQQENYLQMRGFVELAESLVHNNRNTFVEFKRVRKDDLVTEEKFKTMTLDNLPPKEMEKFTRQLHWIEQKRLYNAKHNILPSIQHNLQEYLVPQKPSTLVSRLEDLMTSTFKFVTS